MRTFKEKKDVRVLYMGTPAMSATVLEAIIDEGYDVVALVCQEDKEVGRHHQIEKVPTKIVAEAHNIPVFQPHRIRLDYEFAKTLDFDVIVTMAYGQIIPQGLLDLSKVGNINLHGSLLPKYRGAAPIQRAIMDGEKETGITLMEMVAAMDAGQMYDKRSIAIEDSDTYSSLSVKLSKLAASMIREDLFLYANGMLKGVSQAEDEVTIAKKIRPEDEHLPLLKSAEEACRYIRGISLDPGAYLFLNEKKLKVYNAKVFSEEETNNPYHLIQNKKHFLISFPKGVLELTDVQMEGKKRMDGVSFLQGAHLSEDTVIA